MGRLFKRVVREVSIESRARTVQKVRRIAAADQRAQSRLAWATFAREHPGSAAACVRDMAEAMRRGELPMRVRNGVECVPPTKDLVRLWRRMPPHLVTIEVLRDAPRPGPPRKRWHPAVNAAFELEVGAGRTGNVPELHRHLLRIAREQPPMEGVVHPTLDQVRHRVGEVPYVKRVVSRHGKKAAMADAVVHGAVPADFAHQVWVLDELELPVWLRVYSHVVRDVIAVKVSLCLIVDSASGVVVSYFIANPAARDKMRGMDSWDIMAAVASGLFPELASPACAPYAGWIPHVLRYDRAATHKLTGERLRGVGVKVPNLPGLAPWARGLIENVVKIVKERTVRLKGHEDSYVPAEYMNATLANEADAAAVRPGERATVKQPLLITQLYSIDEITPLIDGIIREFNEEQVHEEFQMPRAARYKLTMREQELRSGRDAISLLEPHRVKVVKRDVKVGRIAFEGTTPTTSFFKGEYVDLRLDPALRGVFAMLRDGTPQFLRPKREAAKTRDAATVARGLHSMVSFFDEQTRAAKEILRQAQVGPDGAEHADAVAEMELDRQAALRALHEDYNGVSDADRAKSKRKRARPKAESTSGPSLQPPRFVPPPAPAPGVSQPRPTRVVPISEAPSRRPAAPGVPRRGLITKFS